MAALPTYMEKVSGEETFVSQNARAEEEPASPDFQGRQLQPLHVGPALVVKTQFSQI